MLGRDAPLNGWKALQLEQQPHSVLVVDDEHGLMALLLHLRAHSPTAHIPVVLMTAGTPPRVDDEHTAVITKPFDVDEFLDQIAYYLG